jgi:hydroxymethylbilane synthase
MNVRLTSRTSALARAQTEIAIQHLKKIGFIISDVIYVKTEGDLKLNTPLIKEGGKGLFIKELEALLLDDKADIAIHSLKDVPLIKNDYLEICGYIQNTTAFDCLVGSYKSIQDLPYNGVVGTSSLRRAGQIIAIRPDIEIKMLRGNVLTRIEKLKSKEFDAIILAEAGIKRLALDVQYTVIETNQMVPAFNQGVIGIQILKDKEILNQKIRSINTIEVELRVDWERKIAKLFKATCQSAFGVYANILSIEPLSVELTVYAFKNVGTQRCFTGVFQHLEDAIKDIKDYFELDSIDWSICEKEFF